MSEPNRDQKKNAHVTSEGLASGMPALLVQPRIVRSALKVSLFVGLVLNVINNGEQLWLHHTVSWWHIAMNFVVPYCVASYSAACNEAQRTRSGDCP